MKYYIVSLLLLPFLTGCGGETVPESQMTTAPGRTSFAQAPAPTPTSSKPGSPATDYLECMGRVEVPPSSRTMVYARSTGYVQGLKLLEGQPVKRGEWLLRMESPEFARLQKSYEEAAAEYNWAEKEYQRAMSLKSSNSISAHDYDQAVRNRDVALAKRDGIHAELKAMGFSEQAIREGKVAEGLGMVSPANGWLSEVHVVNGQRATPETHLFTVVDRKHLHLEVQVPIAEVHRIREGQAFRFTAPGLQDSVSGKVYLINAVADEQMNTVSVHGHLDDESAFAKLTIGERVFVRF